MVRKLSFSTLVANLEAHYGKPRPPKTTEPLGLIIHEAVAYLTTDEKRDAAFDALRAQVGLKPTQILAAPMAQLVSITSLGGIHAELRAARLKEIAQIVLNDFAGDLNNALKLPLPQARKALQKFPSIGAPGAEKILLFTNTQPTLALESNGLRVLLRLGFGEERKNYAASYGSVQEALKDQIGNDCDFLIRAHQLLRRHGKELCRTSNPACEACPLSLSCHYYLSQETATRKALPVHPAQE
jgi:endonuclease III